MSGEEEVSYRELNRRANQMAHYLRGLGVGREALVGICLERSAEMVVAMLGVLKAGGAYVPLDPEYPAERLGWMVEDAGIGVVVSREKELERLPAKLKSIAMDRDKQAIERCDEGAVGGEVSSDKLAYVMYTSGSTGRPKGVMVCHEAINRLVRNSGYVELRPEDRVAHASNPAFDASTFEIWGALLNGASVVPVVQDVVLNIQEFSNTLRKKKISVLFLTTALFSQVVREQNEAFECLRYLFFGGEVVDPRWPKLVLAGGAPQSLCHVYGPTETATFATFFPVVQVDERSGTLPIGRPIGNTRVYILDEWLDLAPIGVPGELYIAGAGVARGYLGRADLTAERFIPNPYGKAEGERMYRTGDLARWGEDGNIEFLGRKDQQVKIRGFRIEPGEIEGVLREQAGVGDAVVVPWEAGEGDKRLAAYVVAKAGEAVDASALRQGLAEKLPGYMIPATFVMLETLPLTPNGKLDRQALPAPDRAGMALGNEYVAPRTVTEEILAGIWADVLGLERVGIHDNFFALGGDSIRSIRIKALAREKGLEFSLQDLFAHQSVMALAEIVRRGNVILFERTKTEPFSLLRNVDRLRLR